MYFNSQFTHSTNQTSEGQNFDLKEYDHLMEKDYPFRLKKRIVDPKIPTILPNHLLLHPAEAEQLGKNFPVLDWVRVY